MSSEKKGAAEADSHYRLACVRQPELALAAFSVVETVLYARSLHVSLRGESIPAYRPRLVRTARACLADAIRDIPILRRVLPRRGIAQQIEYLREFREAFCDYSHEDVGEGTVRLRMFLSCGLAPHPVLHTWFDVGEAIGLVLVQFANESSKITSSLAGVRASVQRLIKLGESLPSLAKFVEACPDAKWSSQTARRLSVLLDPARQLVRHDRDKSTAGQWLRVLNHFADAIRHELETLDSSPISARDRFIYELRVRGTPLKDIQGQLVRNPDFDPIYSLPGIQAACDRYAQRNGLPLARSDAARKRPRSKSKVVESKPRRSAKK